MSERTCLECGGPLVTSKTGYCKRCNPRHKWTPESRANASAARKARWDRELADPAKRAAAVASGKRLRASTPTTKETIAKQVAGRRRAHWLPEGYEDLNRKLKAKGYLAAERKQLIATEVLRDAARREAEREAALTPFERQLARVAAGAKLITVHPMRKADPAGTLGGVATGLL